MKEPRYSLWQVLALLGAGLAIMIVSLCCGLALGFVWGRGGSVAVPAQAPFWHWGFVQPPALPWQEPPYQHMYPPAIPWQEPTSEPGLPPELQPVLGQPHLGVTFENVTPEIARRENLDLRQGAIIREVDPGGPADEAGLRVGDVITAVDGRQVDADHTLRERIMSYNPGDEVELTVVRRGMKMSIMVTLAEARPTEP